MTTSVPLSDSLALDLDRLVDTRLLIQANSGGGKSWCLRRLLEQTHGRVQHLVIDPEGEFASLRERFDYVLAARTGGDTAADPRTARLLAERLLRRILSRSTEPSSEGLAGPEQRILDALAWLESVGVAEGEQAAVAFLAGYTVGGGAFNNPRGRLRSLGLVTYPERGLIRASAALFLE